MAVVVTTQFGAAGTPDARDKYDEGRVAVIHEDKLYVLNRPVGFASSHVQDVVAVYADGQWKRAVIEDA
ncbi:hypothetical protein [Nocardioides ganghwensis]|uniref:Uncharacterized protein n=1 Tax=Nocardioides ganghwensis TaxID=252230 RepID=A0A4Q2SD27_9ACTN|nr:hypothetical protein [Nocardioides ganghwensis]MBD3946479.1 hypothetical protein [Nocardioides ganghwensis]RYC03226.1 hypothetical protein EUA07_06635 [Nocardioides ganghwensis]